VIKLIVVDGPDLGGEFTLTGETIVIGRSNQCDLMLHDVALGRRHCEIRHKENTFVLVDLASVNGTYLNDQAERITTRILHNNDEIILGKSRLRVELPEQVAHKERPVLLTEQEFPPSPPPEVSTPFPTPLTPPPAENKKNLNAEFTLLAALPPPSPLRLSLQVIEGNDSGKIFEISPEVKRFTVGRGETADGILNDRRISRIHLAVEVTPTGFVLVDENSRNGTFLKGQSERIRRLSLHGGEEILLGDTCLRVMIIGTTETLVVLPAEPPVWHIRLRVVAGRDVGKVIEPATKTRRFTVGRDNTADFVLDDRRISRVHFSIELTPTGFVLTDENSRNGTFLKGQAQRVQRLPLRGGEEIQLGETVLQIEISEPVEGTLVASLAPSSFQQSQVLAEPKRVPSEETPLSLSPQENSQPLPPAWVVLGTSFLTLLCCFTLVWFGKPTLQSSAAISVGHAQWENTCRTCHSPWATQPMSASCGTVDCHANDLQVTAQASDQCEQCHTEHRGRRFAIRGGASQCWRCHEPGFRERPLWRYYGKIYQASNDRASARYRLTLPTSEEGLSAWKNSTPHQETGLIFAHAAHAKASQLQECLACHQPLPGTVINALGAVSAFPSHDECIDCHSEVGDRDPQLARQNPSPRCQKCHTREDGQVTRVQRTLPFVHFSHDNHKTTDCETCHFMMKEEHTYRPVERSTLYALPMEACVSCHQQEQVTTSCTACHRAHHHITVQPTTTNAKSNFLSPSEILLAVLVLQIGIGVYLYVRPQ